MATHGFGLFAGLFLGRLFKVPAQFHFPEHAFALQLLLERAQCLIDVVVANLNVNDGSILQLLGGVPFLTGEAEKLVSIGSGHDACLSGASEHRQPVANSNHAA